MTDRAVRYKRHRFPAEIIAHAVWLYFRFPLSLRLVEEMLLDGVSYETIRVWAVKFGAQYARRLKRKAPSRHDIWHLDEAVISIRGERRYLWRAVDQDGYVLDEIVQIHRNTKAARRLLTRLLSKQGRPPKRIITDKLGSYGAAKGCGHAECRASPPQRVEQSGGEFPCAHPKTGADDARVSVLERTTKVRLNLLRLAQSFRSATLPSLRSLHPLSSPEGHDGVEIRHRRRSLKTDGVGQTALNES